MKAEGAPRWRSIAPPATSSHRPKNFFLSKVLSWQRWVACYEACSIVPLSGMMFFQRGNGEIALLLLPRSLITHPPTMNHTPQSLARLR